MTAPRATIGASEASITTPALDLSMPAGGQLSSALAPRGGWATGSSRNAASWGSGALGPIVSYPAARTASHATARNAVAPMSTMLSEQAVNNFDGFPVTATMRVGALSDNSQMQYAEGTSLWLMSTPNDVGTASHALFATQNLNFLLEKVASLNVERTAVVEGADDVFHPGHAKRAKTSSSPLENIPLTINEFVRRFQLVGVASTFMGPQQSRTPTAAVVVKRRAWVPGQWGAVKPGQAIGYMVKAVASSRHALVDHDGKVVGGPTAGTFLQIIPHVETTCNQPVHSSAFRAPGDNDLDFYERRNVAQRHAPASTDAAGGVTFDIDAGAAAPPVGAPLSYDAYVQGAYYRLGIVKRRGGQQLPPADLIAQATRSFEAQTELFNISHVDVEVDLTHAGWIV